MYEIEDSENVNKADLKFKITGMICYSGAHYICYFKNLEGFKPPQAVGRGNYGGLYNYSRKPE